MLGHAAHIARGLVGETGEGRAFRLRLDDAAKRPPDEERIVDRTGGGREFAHRHAEPGAEVHMLARLHQPTGLGQLAVDRHSRTIFGVKNVLPRLTTPM